MTKEEKLKDIVDHPENHQHNFDSLQACGFHDGALDLQILDAHEGVVYGNGGRGSRCDVVSGPCSCGGWH